MKIYADVVQGSEAWHRLRLGIPTASNFQKIVTKKKAGLSKQATDYALRLVAERLLNMTAAETFDQLPWLERGREYEPMAVKQYEFQHDARTIAVGFITTDDGSMGCSPDRLVLGDKRHALEIKCPSQHVHLGYALRAFADKAALARFPALKAAEDDYRPQVQGQILVAELERVDLYSYHPQCPPALIRTERDDKYIAKLSAALREFSDLLAGLYDLAKKMGAYQPMARSTTPAEVREVTDLNREFKRQSEAQFVKEGFAG